MATVLNMNIDTGSHNYYVHGPTLGKTPSPRNQLWRVISIDSDWGFGYDYGCYQTCGLGTDGIHRCTNCHNSVSLIDENGQSFNSVSCPPDDPNLATFYCGTNRMSSLINADPVIYGNYLAFFVDFLEQDFTQPCALTNAVDALMGPQGVLAAAIERDAQHWHSSSFDRAREVRFINGFLRARLAYLKQVRSGHLRFKSAWFESCSIRAGFESHRSCSSDSTALLGAPDMAPPCPRIDGAGGAGGMPGQPVLPAGDPLTQDPLQAMRMDVGAGDGRPLHRRWDSRRYPDEVSARQPCSGVCRRHGPMFGGTMRQRGCLLHCGGGGLAGRLRLRRACTCIPRNHLRILRQALDHGDS